MLEQTALKVLTLSCPERDLQAAQILETLPLRVILVPNEQNNYNRQLQLHAAAIL